MSLLFLTKLADLARFHFQAGREGEAEAACRELLRLDPANAEANYLLARILLSAARYVEALELLEPATRAHPELKFITDDCRAAFIKASRIEQGVACFQLLSDRHPELPHLRINLGLIHREARRDDAAKACFEQVLEMEPEHIEGLYLMGHDAVKRARYVEAEGLLRKAADRAPQRSDLLNAHAGVLKTLGRADEAAESYRRAVELSPGDSRLYSNYLMNFLCTDRFSPEYCFERHLAWAGDKAPSSSRLPGRRPNLPDPARRLRIGYVSADFRIHPVAFFIEPILTLHNRDEVEVYCYAQIGEPDYITEQFRARQLVWRPITDLSDQEAAQLIRDDGIDILVDLNGHTACSRLLIFAHRPAPVQVSWLGYAHSTGLAGIDYRFTDLIADPPGLSEHLHSERLYRLPGSFICYQPPLAPPPVTELPFVRNGYITFGAFNNMAKWTPAMLDLWSDILHEVPGSRLLIKVAGLDCPQLRDYVTQLFAGRGVEAERLVLLPRVPTVLDHLRCFCQADISLDSFPYNGTTTTCESLFMGVPVITLAGRSHVSRVGASILAASGLEDLIAGTPKHYLEAAVALARDKRRLEGYRLGLREQVKGTPFFQVASFTRNLEAAYRDIWRSWCDSQEKQGAKDHARPAATGRRLRGECQLAVSIQAIGEHMTGQCDDPLHIAQDLLRQGNLALAEIYARQCLTRDGSNPGANELLEDLRRGYGFSQTFGLSELSKAADDSRNRFLLIKAWGYGFWSEVHHLASQLLLAELTRRTPLILWGSNCIFRKDSDINAISYFFQEVSPARLEDVPRSATIYPPKWSWNNLYRENVYKWEGAGSRLAAQYLFDRPETLLVSDFYSPVGSMIPWIGGSSRYYGLSEDALYAEMFQKYLKPTAGISSKAEEFFDQHMRGRHWVGVHVRGSDKIDESKQIDRINAESLVLTDAIVELNPSIGVFLLTDSLTLVEEFKTRHGERLLYTQASRSASNVGVHHMSNQDGIAIGEEVLLDVLLGLKCDYFVGNQESNVSLAISSMRNWPQGSMFLLGERNIRSNSFCIQHNPPVAGR